MFQLRKLFVLIFVTDHIAAVVFEDCGSAYDLTDVSIDGCQLGLPCFITLGESVPVSVQFVADSPYNLLDQDVVLTINFINLRLNVTPERCESVICGTVVPNAVSSLTSMMSVQRSIAVNQRGYLRWRVFDERRRQVLCYSVLVQTRSSLQKYLEKLFYRGLVTDSQNITHNSFD